jgi:hypothetical protein
LCSKADSFTETPLDTGMPGIAAPATRPRAAGTGRHVTRVMRGRETFDLAMTRSSPTGRAPSANTAAMFLVITLPCVVRKVRNDGNRGGPCKAAVVTRGVNAIIARKQA